MSENMEDNHEKNEGHELGKETESQGEFVKVRHEKREEVKEADKIDVEKVRDKVESLAPAEKVDLDQKIDAKPAVQNLPPPGQSLRAAVLNSSLSNIRRHLKRRDKAFSKFIHNPTINSISEVTGKTLARPYGLLCGGICFSW